MAVRGTARQARARRAVAVALVVVNGALLLTLVGAAGATSQARRALDPGTVSACAQRAASQLRTAYVDGSTPRFVGEDTIRFRGTAEDGTTLTVTCRLAEPDPDTDGALPVRSVQVGP